MSPTIFSDKNTKAGPRITQEGGNHSWRTRVAGIVCAVLLTFAASACSSGDDADQATESTSPATTAAPTTAAPTTAEPTSGMTEPPIAPANIEANDQTGDGSMVMIKLVKLPSPGFIVVHRNDDGFPGEIVAVSERLDTGIHENITVDLAVKLTEEEALLPMLHVDVDDSGAYEETEPPGFIEEGGDMAIVAIHYSVG